MAALRLARAHTGRDSYVVIEGGYHGVFDAALWTTLIEDWRPSAGDPHLVPYSAGVPGILRSLLHAVPMNDADRLESVFKAYGDQIAAFLIEPIMGNCCSIAATREYLHAARALCDRYGILLIIDEVKTGFRVARGGCQELFGVRSDLCTFAKAMANGYPISVLAGREDIMRRLGKGVVHGGTFTAHSVALAAAEKCLQILAETPALQTIAEYGTRLRAGISQISDPARHQAFVQRTSIDERTVLQRARRRGIIAIGLPAITPSTRRWHRNCTIWVCCCEPDSREPWFICEAHDERCLAETLERFEIAVDRVVNAARGSGPAHCAG